MGKYLIQGSYTVDGAKGLIKDGGTGRKAAIVQLLKSVGGTLDSLYFPLGTDDFVLLVDLPDNVAATAVSVAVAGSGAARLRCTPLLTPEEMDAATKKGVKYRRPGR